MPDKPEQHEPRERRSAIAAARQAGSTARRRRPCPAWSRDSAPRAPPQPTARSRPPAPRSCRRAAARRCGPMPHPAPGARSARDQARMARERQPELIVGVVQAAGVAAERLRRDADDHVGGLVDRDAPSDDVRIAVEADLPDPMTDHRFRLRARRVIHLREARSERQRDADGREVIARHVHRRHRNRRDLCPRAGRGLRRGSSRSRPCRRPRRGRRGSRGATRCR